MNCEDIKKIIPKYFRHQASEAEIKMVEEHLCICHNCRTDLGELMDKKEVVNNLHTEENNGDKIDEKHKVESNLPEIKIVFDDKAISDIPRHTAANEDKEVFTANRQQEDISVFSGNNDNKKMGNVAPLENQQFVSDEKKLKDDKQKKIKDAGENKETEGAGEDVRISFKDEFGECEEKEDILNQRKSEKISKEIENEKQINRTPKKIDFFEYISLTLGIIVLIFVSYLLIRG